MLMSGFAWSMIELVIVVEGGDILRYFYGPLPHTFCVVSTVVIGSVFLQILLFITTIVITKYIFIFHLKNPTALDDKFWLTFLTLWIRIFAYLSQITAYFMQGKYISQDFNALNHILKKF